MKRERNSLPEKGKPVKKPGRATKRGKGRKGRGPHRKTCPRPSVPIVIEKKAEAKFTQRNRKQLNKKSYKEI